jgi:hypothetical protein
MSWEQSISLTPKAISVAPFVWRPHRPRSILLSLVSILLAAVSIGALNRVASGLDLSRPLPDLVTAINQGDSVAISALLLEESEEWTARGEWLAGTAAVISLSSCTGGGDTPATTCTVHFGNNWFYNRAAPPEVAKHGSFGTVLTVEIEGDQLRVVDFPLPAGLAEVEDPFHQWAVQTHPRSAPLMWEAGGPSIESRIRLDGTGGAAHQALLDEYVDFLQATTRHSPG